MMMKNNIMKTIIAGSRNFDDYDTLKNVCNKYQITEVVCGGAQGADALGERYARENNIPIVYFRADWDKYGKSAGPIRNDQMAQYADFLIAFWDGQSKGTHNMIKTAQKHNMNYTYFTVDPK